MDTGRRLAAIVSPYRSQAIAQAIGCSRQQVHAWRTGAALPDISWLPKLAEFLKIDLAELTQIIADDANRRAVA